MWVHAIPSLKIAGASLLQPSVASGLSSSEAGPFHHNHVSSMQYKLFCSGDIFILMVFALTFALVKFINTFEKDLILYLLFIGFPLITFYWQLVQPVTGAKYRSNRFLHESSRSPFMTV